MEIQASCGALLCLLGGSLCIVCTLIFISSSVEMPSISHKPPVNCRHRHPQHISPLFTRQSRTHVNYSSSHAVSRVTMQRLPKPVSSMHRLLHLLTLTSCYMSPPKGYSDCTPQACCCRCCKPKDPIRNMPVSQGAWLYQNLRN